MKLLNDSETFQILITFTGMEFLSVCEFTHFIQIRLSLERVGFMNFNKWTFIETLLNGCYTIDGNLNLGVGLKWTLKNKYNNCT